MPRRGISIVAENPATAGLRMLAVAAAVTFGSFSALAQLPPPASASDVFGEEVMLEGKPIVFMADKATWDSAFATLTGKFKAIAAFLDRQKLKAAGPMLTIYTAVSDKGFDFQAAVPLAQAPADLPRGDVKAGQSPVGKALKFVYRGSYDSMDVLYEAITHYLEEKRIERQGLFFEEYITDPLTTPEDKLVVNVFVMVKEPKN
jgi:effector-binding domain-containing protein